MKVDTARWLAKLGGWLVPSQCLLCRGPGQPLGFDLCTPCEADLRRLESPCPRCGMPAPRTSPLAAPGCDQCRMTALHFRQAFAPFQYAAPVDGIVHDLKYGGALANARVLGTLLGRALLQQGLHAGIDALVPMPLHPLRLVERGFNQSYEIARYAARCLGRPVLARALARTRATSAQVDLSRAERERNVKGAFGRGSQATRVNGVRVALVDDVVTTGSTASEAARALVELGALSVDVWAVARAV